MALTFTPLVNPNFIAPDFSLPAVNGAEFTLSQSLKGKPFLLVFMCNHCPYVKAIEDRLISLAHDLKTLNIATVCISSNDATSHPEDSFENLKARAQLKKYPFPYLYDESQQTAKAYEAVCTPDFYLFSANHKMFYRGRLDDSWKNEAEVKSRDLWQASLDLIQNKPLSFQPKPSMGCNIKWKA